MSELALSVPHEWIEAVAERVAELLVERAEPELEQWFSVANAAAYFDCSVQRIYDLRSSGVLGRYSDGGRALVKRAELDALALPPDGGNGSRSGAGR